MVNHAGQPNRQFRDKMVSQLDDKMGRQKQAQYLKKLSTEEYKILTKQRNGVEGVPSVLRRRYQVDSMPVRGLLRSKMWFALKIGAINVKRVLAKVLLPTFISFQNYLSSSFYNKINFSEVRISIQAA